MLFSSTCVTPRFYNTKYDAKSPEFWSSIEMSDRPDKESLVSSHLGIVFPIFFGFRDWISCNYKHRPKTSHTQNKTTTVLIFTSAKPPFFCEPNRFVGVKTSASQPNPHEKTLMRYVCIGVKASNYFMPKETLSEKGPGGGGWILMVPWIQKFWASGCWGWMDVSPKDVKLEVGNRFVFFC